MSQCSHGSCSHDGQHSHSHQECCSCHNCNCSCHDSHCKYSEELIQLADDAWMEVLFEKIKEEIQKNGSEHIAQLAKLVAETNHKRWTKKMEAKSNLEEFEERLANLVCKNQSK